MLNILNRLVNFLTITSIFTVGGLLYYSKSLKDHVVIQLPTKFGVVSNPNAFNNPIIRLLLGGEGFCTGFVVDDNYAVTAAHCLNIGGKLLDKPIEVYNDQGVNTRVVAKAAGFAERSDLGLILGDFRNFKKLKVQFDQFGFASQGQYISCGFPYGSKLLSCNNIYPVDTQDFFVKAKGYLVPGMSGGPVIDPNGQAVGLNTAVTEGGILLSPLQGYLGAFGLDR